MSTFSERLIFLMEYHDMKQTELADRVGISKQSLYKYIRCHCEPRADVIAKMAVALNTSADYLVGLSSNPNKEDKIALESGNTVDFSLSKKECALTKKIRKLSPENLARIDERVDMLLEQKK